MKLRTVCSVLCAVTLVAGGTFGAEVLRLNFDEAPVEMVEIPYTGGPTDIISAGITIDLDDITNGRPQNHPSGYIDVSAPAIATPDAPGPQGGNVLQLDQEDSENPQGEGLFVIGLPGLTGAWTVEAIFRTMDPLFAPTEYNIQNIIGTENAAADVPKFEARIFGDGLNGLGIPATGQIQSGDLSGGPAFDGPSLEANVWYHLAMVYDGAGTLTGYLDETAFGSSNVNYSGMSLSMIGIGYYMSDNDTPNESIRGLFGDIDAVSISDQALAPGQFRLLGGAPSNVADYELY